ncbi:bifunctional UDP-N-acetylglucosamine diphosphorylase/glucosamine-1-phosphate N-acetyltransferase GlmU [Spiribacter insolitus]|uniref:Bifunctional protein GlmU n=1 Tax=Spiribacter insolitus TaxID=3122417 RepID=A0ABV3T8I0_9GAMM
MSSQPLSVVVLAAGEGKRMRSTRPKVLQTVAGRPMLAHVLDAASALKPEAIHVVYGHGGDAVQAAFANRSLAWALQSEQLGTGHAVAQALPAIPDDHQILVLCADVPLIRPATLEALVSEASGALSLLTVALPDPTGYGRVLRGEGGAVDAIIEEKDATPAQRAVTEVNTGVMCLPAQPLRRWLGALDAGNAQGEYYLTDCIAMARRDGWPVHPLACTDPWEVQGVNDRAQLAAVERAAQHRQAVALMRDQGLGLADPARFDLRGELTVGRDCSIDASVIIEGTVTLGDDVHIGPFTRLCDCHIQPGTRVLAHCDIEGSEIGHGCRIGPFARLRPGTSLADRVRVGNFVETKQAHVGLDSKINHLSYIGDTQLGAEVNVGAGTITCNYDGREKHVTRIGDRVFIGSNTALVAPLTVGEGVTIGAGTTVREDIPADTLTVETGHLRQIPGWRSKERD